MTQASSSQYTHTGQSPGTRWGKGGGHPLGILGRPGRERCPVEVGFPTQSMTIAVLEYLARKGVLYFNLHTKANTSYGEVRGQIYPATPDAK
jgi:hypothetical protein